MNQRALKIALIGIVVAIYSSIVIRAFGSKEQAVPTQQLEIPQQTTQASFTPALRLDFEDDIWITAPRKQVRPKENRLAAAPLARQRKRSVAFQPTVAFPVMRHVGYIKASNQSLPTAIISDERGRLVYLTAGSVYQKDFRVTSVSPDSISVTSTVLPDSTLILYRLAQG